jgi:uncharacterized protein (TIGR02646 family)
MRTIKKGIIGNNRNLNTALKNNGIPKNSEEATRAWGNFNDVRQLLQHKLLEEQFGLCCYTELNLATLCSVHNIGAHFEHEQPKKLYPERAFDESNLLRCALSSHDLMTFSSNDRFGGHFKDNNPLYHYDAKRFISPQSQNCRKFFVYIITDGSIVPRGGLQPDEQDRAQYTIDFLNLNAPFLKAERERWLQELDLVLMPLVNNLEKDAISNLADCELTLTNLEHPELNKPAYPQLRQFHSATRLLFGALGERIIQANCPQID